MASACAAMRPERAPAQPRPVASDGHRQRLREPPFAVAGRLSMFCLGVTSEWGEGVGGAVGSRVSALTHIEPWRAHQISCRPYRDDHTLAEGDDGP